MGCLTGAAVISTYFPLFGCRSAPAKLLSAISHLLSHVILCYHVLSCRARTASEIMRSKVLFVRSGDANRSQNIYL